MSDTGQQHSDTVDLANVARVVRRGWWLVLLCMVVGAAAAVAVIKWAPPRFTGTASVEMRNNNDRSGGILGQLGGAALGGASALLTGSKGALDTEAGLISSRVMVGEVVDRLRLQARIIEPRGIAPSTVVASYALPGTFRPVTYEFTRDSTTGNYRVVGSDGSQGPFQRGVAELSVGDVTFADSATLPAVFTLAVTDRSDAVTALIKKLDVEKPGGDMLKVVYRGADSLTAARVPDALLEVYLRRRKTGDRSSNQQRVEFLSAHIDTLSRSLSASENALRRKQEQTGVLDPVIMGKLQGEQQGLLRAQLTELEIEERGLTQLLDSVRAGRATVRQIEAFPTFLLKAASLTEQMRQLAQLEADRDKLLESLRPTDRVVLTKDSAIRRIEQRLVPLATTYLAGVSGQRRGIQAKLDTLDRFIATMPATAEAELSLQADIKTKGTIYAAVRAQLVDARLAALTEGGSVRLLDPAEVPKDPSFPRPMLTMAAGVGGGFFLGLVVAVLVGTLGRWTRDPFEIERSTGVPTLRFDPRAPLMVGAARTRTVLVAPLDAAADAAPVVQRLMQTAASRAIRATTLDLSSAPADADVTTMVVTLERDHDLVIVQLPALVSDAAAALLHETRPVLLVTPDRRVDRTGVTGAVNLLKRLDVPCAGIVMSGRLNGRVGAPRQPAAVATIES
jgi:tyrosine-protein kinase Etk/Wzc